MLTSQLASVKFVIFIYAKIQTKLEKKFLLRTADVVVKKIFPTNVGIVKLITLSKIDG